MRPTPSVPDSTHEIVKTTSNAGCPHAENFYRNIPPGGICFHKAIGTGQERKTKGTPIATIMADVSTAAQGGNKFAAGIQQEITEPIAPSLQAAHAEVFDAEANHRTPPLSTLHQRIFDETCGRCQKNCLIWLQHLAES